MGLLLHADRPGGTARWVGSLGHHVDALYDSTALGALHLEHTGRVLPLSSPARTQTGIAFADIDLCSLFSDLEHLRVQVETIFMFLARSSRQPGRRYGATELATSFLEQQRQALSSKRCMIVRDGALPSWCAQSGARYTCLS